MFEPKKAPGVDDVYFYYGHNMRQSWVRNNSLFLSCIGRKIRQSIRASLIAEKITIAEVDVNLSPKFKSEEDKNKHLASLES